MNEYTPREFKFSTQARKLIEDYYMLDTENDIEQVFRRASNAFSKGDAALAERMFDYVSKGWMMYSSPVISNAPTDDGITKFRGLPISCFLTALDDSLESLIDHSTETRWLSISGGGIGADWSRVRYVSDKAPGVIPFLHTMDADVTAYKQGKTRKGAYAAYLDVSHPDILEFINIRVPTGGDVNRKCFNVHNAVTIPDEFMKAVIENRDWNLIDPHTKAVKNTINARELWERILEIRFRTGEPYFLFKDTANKALPKEMRDAGFQIRSSNLCNEIMLPTDADYTAVCCLSSVNLEYFDQWKDTEMVEDLTVFLNNVLDYFIENAQPTLANAIKSAKFERSIGIGAMGFHSYLQMNDIEWESLTAKMVNMQIFKHIKEKALKQSEAMGRCDAVSTRRNAHLLAIAPNANSGMMLGTSPSIEPLKSNAYVHRTRVGSHFIKNRYLDQLLQRLEMNTEEVWDSITKHHGSVQHLEFLSEHDKAVFKTAFELDQRWIIEHAADRQQFVCQGQSVNLFFPLGTAKSYVNQVHLDAWKKGLKGLYYLRTESDRKIESVSNKVIREKLVDYDECLSCQG